MADSVTPAGAEEEAAATALFEVAFGTATEDELVVVEVVRVALEGATAVAGAEEVLCVTSFYSSLETTAGATGAGAFDGVEFTGAETTVDEVLLAWCLECEDPAATHF